MTGYALVACWVALAQSSVELEAPRRPVPQYGIYELTVRCSGVAGNPFTDVDIEAEFKRPGAAAVRVQGFCDDPQGRLYRVRFCPDRANTRYEYRVVVRGAVSGTFSGQFRTSGAVAMRPVIVHPDHPKHFAYAGTKRPFYHMGWTAYHLLDPTNELPQIEALLDYCTKYGFNKIRFLLTGYPRDHDVRPHGSPAPLRGDPWRLPNYGAAPGEVNALPAWMGQPHQYDFTRFNVAYWRKVDRVVYAMQRRGIVATCILTIEKQGLPQEYGALTDAEKLLYRYAVARLAAYSNVWWDLGNEHNEYRDRRWARTMGKLVKAWDPYDRLVSAHAYDEWLYDNEPWADWIITQHYGDWQALNRRVLRYAEIPKPYVNEEYGYEGNRAKPGHLQNVELVRRSHWAIALAGGYATYGDWTRGAPFYAGHIGAGQAPAQLKWLRETLEKLPYVEMTPANKLIEGAGLCLAKQTEVYLVYLPEGGSVVLRTGVLETAARWAVTWLDPRTGREKARSASGERLVLRAPDARDWVVIVRRHGLRRTADR